MRNFCLIHLIFFDNIFNILYFLHDIHIQLFNDIVFLVELAFQKLVILKVLDELFIDFGRQYSIDLAGQLLLRLHLLLKITIIFTLYN
jgi:hypothetical protein